MSKEMMLKGNELFKSLSVEEVARISAFSSVKEFSSNDIIFIHGRPGTHVYMLMEGMVRLQLPSDAQEFNFNITKIGKGELFGISSLLNSPRYTASAKCFSPTRVLAIEAIPLQKILQRNCLVGMDIMSRVARIYFTRYIDFLGKLQETISRFSDAA